ncbi:MAG: manganese efflux pump MntP family protein [Lachnospiraceae bacterium]|nr:manganese efflux pump MntP family protein [Lachnospiraceae bacterium]
MSGGFVSYHLLFIINSVALGAGLAMDAFSVSVANGLREPKMLRRRMFAIAGVYAGFQFLMPLTGWFLVHTAITVFSAMEPFIPWIALLLLVFIGGKMILEGIRESRDAGSDAPAHSPAEEKSVVSLRLLLVQGIATSIDALSVGFTIAEYQVLEALCSSLIIGSITLVICLAGLRLGKAFGLRLAHRATILGGIILIAIGLEIWISGVFF